MSSAGVGQISAAIFFISGLFTAVAGAIPDEKTMAIAGGVTVASLVTMIAAGAASTRGPN